jgi:anti-anti-sigma factor
MDRPPSFICTWRFGRYGSLWIDLAGELDRSHCPDLERILEEAQIFSNLVVLDMRELTFMDVAAAHIVIDAGVQARSAGQGLIVARGPSQVDAVFTSTGEAEQVELFDLDREGCPPVHNGFSTTPLPARGPPPRAWRDTEARPSPGTTRRGRAHLSIVRFRH